MFDPTSRYDPIETVRETTPDGREIAFKRRRFLPEGRRMPLLAEVVVEELDRLDRITAKTLGEPTQYWRICDANDAVDPLELTEKEGRMLRIPVPQP